jgi:hypothetical protein
MTAAEMLCSNYAMPRRERIGIALRVEGGIMQRSLVKVRRVRVLIYCPRFL